jgi:hypothetical protein
MENNNHRKFLKGNGFSYRGGREFPVELKMLPDDTEAKNFNCLREVEYGSILFIISTACDACKIDPIKKFSQAYEDFDYYLFYDTDETTINEAKNDLPHFKGVHLCELRTLNTGLDYGAIVPWVFTINNKGQIISGSPFSDEVMLESILEPFSRTFYPKKDKHFIKQSRSEELV